MAKQITFFYNDLLEKFITNIVSKITIVLHNFLTLFCNNKGYNYVMPEVG